MTHWVLLFVLFCKCYLNLAMYHWLLIWISLIFFSLLCAPCEYLFYVLLQYVKDPGFSKADLTSDVLLLDFFSLLFFNSLFFCHSWFCATAAAFIFFEKDGFLSSVHLCVCLYTVLFFMFISMELLSFRYLLMSCNNTDCYACHAM